jgi:drug/metabolite transporter (DMT)-like permease
LAIWGFAFGYFACYAPYSALTKALSTGALEGMTRGISGFELLPSTTLASLVGMFTFLTLMGWWRHAGRRTFLGVSLPWPGRWTFLSGLCTAAIIGTTTLAYTFEGTSIVFMMLLMRGGVLILAPLVDAWSGRRVRWPSWVALGLSLAAVAVATGPGVKLAVTVAALVDVAVYLLGYFIRLRFMSHQAKAEDPHASRRYFVEEQMVATPAIVLTLAVLALVGEGRVMLDIRQGFTGFLERGQLGPELFVGLLSQGTGIFGALILLDPRENSFCVPVNRASSVLAGVLASWGLAHWLGMRGAGPRELVGAMLVMAAIAVLSVPSVLKAHRASRAARETPAGRPAP